jgi:hypothetical protein
MVRVVRCPILAELSQLRPLAQAHYRRLQPLLYLAGCYYNSTAAVSGLTSRSSISVTSSTSTSMSLTLKAVKITISYSTSSLIVEEFNSKSYRLDSIVRWSGE